MANFNTIWSNFPDGEKIKSKCFNKQPTSEQPFSNYCAILMSECLIRSGIQVSSCPGTKCWSHSGSKHLLLANDLAVWLAKTPPTGIGRKEKIKAGSFQQKLSGRTGIVFFKDYWTRGNESFENRSGDHIDLWNKYKITGGSMFYRSIIELFGFVSDLNKSREIWFWEIK